MLTASLGIEYEDGWTSDLKEYDVYGEWPASNFYEAKYFGVMFLWTSEFDEVVETIRTHRNTNSVDIVSRMDRDDLTGATLLIRQPEIQQTPMRTLLQKGFLPLRPTRLKNGVQKYDLLFEKHENIAEAVNLLSEYGPVTTEVISQKFNKETTPSNVEWQELIGSITPDQCDLFVTAVEEGYFEIPRRVTLEELGTELGVTKGTVSHQLRKVQNAFADFIVTYLYQIEP
jgi:predicted DNA binding protein